MKYEQPEIVAVGTVLASVQAGQKTTGIPVDDFQLKTVGAYEADE